MGNSQKIGVVLFQLGGPDSLDAVEPFLYNLFSDPDIIDFPFAKLAREPLARLMASWRAKKVSRDYDIIGGKSPLKELTLLQAAALEKELAKICPAKVRVAMRYWHPFTEEAIKELETESLEQLVSAAPLPSVLKDDYRQQPERVESNLRRFQDGERHNGTGENRSEILRRHKISGSPRGQRSMRAGSANL